MVKSLVNFNMTLFGVGIDVWFDFKMANQTESSINPLAIFSV